VARKKIVRAVQPEQYDPLPGQSAFAFFGDDPFSEEESRYEVRAVSSPFTVLIDSREQRPYDFTGILGNYQDDHCPISVRTRRTALSVGDYSIGEITGIAIERKTAKDLFSSLANTTKRQNFEDRLVKMTKTLQWGAVVVECNADAIYTVTNPHTLLNPKTVYRTALSWSLRYPAVHWFFCADRDFAEQTTYRLLEKFFEQAIDPNNKRNFKTVIQDHTEAFRLGFLARSAVNVSANIFAKNDTRAIAFRDGWTFCSNHRMEGDLGKLIPFEKREELDEIPASPLEEISETGALIP